MNGDNSEKIEYWYFINFAFIAVLLASQILAILIGSCIRDCRCWTLGSHICHTILICGQAGGLVFLLFWINRYLLEYPAKRRDYIDGLRQVRLLLNGCSDDLT